jgi:hypothetical protein
MHDNPINGQQFYCSALSDDQIDPPDQMGTNCAPLLADLFLYSYEADFFFFQ